MSNEAREDGPEQKHGHFIRWPLAAGTVGSVVYMVYAMLNRAPGEPTDAAQIGFGLALMFGIGAALAWNRGGGKK